MRVLVPLALVLVGCSPRVVVRPETRIEFRPPVLVEAPEEHAERVMPADHDRAEVAQAAGASNSRVTRVERVPGQRAPGGRRGGRGYAFFEFAPTGGAGMGAPCACTTPSGAKGEALTFTRASNGTCTKTTSGGLTTTGIANGDLVVCTNNQPRVEYDSQGVLGLLVESSRTNSALRSQELDNAAWISVTTAGAVTVTADFAVAPDGTTTAERIQYTACPTASTSSSRGQTGMVGLGTSASGSFYVKGNGTSGNVGLALGAGAAYVGATCAYNSSTWTRCVLTSAVTTSEIYIGCFNNAVVSPNPGNTGSGDIFVWGGQAEAGAYATSYIPTVAAAVTRSAESPTFAMSGLSQSQGSSAATITSEWSALALGFVLNFDANSQVIYTQNGGTQTFRSFDSTTIVTSGATTVTPGASLRLWSSYGPGAGSNQSINNGTTTTTGSFDGTMGTSLATLQVGQQAGGSQIDSIVSRICIDPDPSRCR